ncbi:hypothetical protein STEG23_024303 [Scotinomys teguina]
MRKTQLGDAKHGKSEQMNRNYKCNHNEQEIGDTMKRPNLRIIGIEEIEKYQLKGTENIFNKILEYNFPNVMNETPTKIEEAYKTPNILDLKKMFACHIIIYTLTMQNKEKKLRAAKEKGQLLKSILACKISELGTGQPCGKYPSIFRISE